MASFGVDRYGRPLGYDQQANPYNDQKENNPAASQPDQNTSQQSGQFASSGGSFGMPGTTQNPNTGISPPPAPAPAPTQAPPRADYPQAPAPTAPAGGQYNTDGYAQPGYVASNYGQAPAGWDATKWNDPNYQTPKYTVGRILTEAGNLADPNIRNTAIQHIQQAYPGAQFDGKDKISIDGGRSWVDIFGASGAGVYSPAWMPVEQGGGAPQPGGMAQQLAQSVAGGGGGGGSYGGAASFTAPPNAIYKPGQLPSGQLPIYDPMKMSQFEMPNQGISNALQTQLMNQMLANPHSMSDQNVAQLKGQQTDEALLMNKQLQDQLMQQGASRGAMGGSIDSGQRRLASSLADSVLGGNRQIDLQKMQQDRADELGALGASNDVLGGQMGRATSGYGAQLSGQQAQAAQNMAGHDSQAQQVQFALQQALSQEDLNKAGADSAFSAWLNGNQLGLDSQRIGNQSAQFNMSNDLANRQFADDMKKWRAGLNYQYQSGAQGANQSFWG
jgi:hypothetical protein